MRVHITNDPLLDAFRRMARDRPEHVLLLDGGQPVRVERIAAGAEALGERIGAAAFPPGSTVALVADNGAAFFEGLIALRRGGRIVLLVDAGSPQPAVVELVERVGAAGWIRWNASRRGDKADWIIARSPGEPTSIGPAERAAMIKLTSGSTGSPRGIVVSSDALLADVRALTVTMGIRPDDRVLAMVPFSHSYGLSVLALPALVDGRRLVIPRRDEPFGALDAVRTAGVTVVPTVPAYLAALLRLERPPILPPSVRLVLTAGAPLQPAVAREFRVRFGRPVHAFYGASECGGISFDRRGNAAEMGTVGDPVDGVTVELCPVAAAPHADVGRVVVSSAAVGERYLDGPDPRLQEGRFQTEDLGRWTEDGLRLEGRLSDVINVKGRKVSPVEVERTILDMPGVDDVRIVPLARPGTDESVVRAIVSARDASLTATRVIEWCRGRLNDYKVPRSVTIVDRLPVDDRGKIDRRQLARLAGSAPDA